MTCQTELVIKWWSWYLNLGRTSHDYPCGIEPRCGLCNGKCLITMRLDFSLWKANLNINVKKT